jgi:hypothetical protein
VKSFLKHFRPEFEYHIQNKHCLVTGPDVQPKWGRAGAYGTAHNVTEIA